MSSEEPPRVVIRRHGSGARCRELRGVPVLVSALIEIVPAPTAAAVAAAGELADAVVGALRSAAPALVERDVACPGAAYDPGVPAEWNRLLVLVADAGAPGPIDTAHPVLAHWLANESAWPVYPLLQVGGKAETLLAHPALEVLNASFWSSTPAENVDEVLALADLGAEERRVFVSYRRPETLKIAEQLFEELEKHRFDVFVDRFRVPPAHNFQERLTDELVHKSMVLVLESPTILDSRWVAHELNFAKDHQLGRLAVHLPGGVAVPWLENQYRVLVTENELVPSITPESAAPAVTAAHELSPQALSRVIARLVAEHTNALVRRRGEMLDNLRGALRSHPNVSQRLDATGHLHVTATPATAKVPWAHRSAPREYVVWISPRPPEIDSFRMAHGVCDPGPDPTGAIVTAATYQSPGRREGYAWLAGRSLVRLYEDTNVRDLAARIARGEDLP